MKPVHIFQFITNPVCGRYRFNIPAKYLEKDGQFTITAFHKLDKTIYQALLDEGDILIIQRLPFSSQLQKIVKTLNARGKIVIYEIDDDLFNLPPDSNYLKKAPADYTSKLTQAVQLCQAVQCSTRGLAEVLSNFHDEVYVLENQLDETDGCDARQNRDGGATVIGYGAGENHWNDWLTIKDAVNQFAQAERDVEFWIFGDEKIYNSLEAKNKKLIPLLSFADYLRVLRLVDISLIPLEDNKFNHSKSDIKFLESAASCCAVLASQQVYSETIRHDFTGLLFSNSHDFSVHLKKLSEDKRLVRELGKAACHYVKSERLMSHHIKKWQDTYRDLFSRRDSLLRTAKHKLQKSNG